MPKNILIFSLAYYPSFVSGAEAAVKEITDRIDPSDTKFHLITLLFEREAEKEEEIGNIMVHRVGFGGGYISKILFIPLAVLKAHALHREHTFDAFWSVMTYMLFPVVLSKITGINIPHVLTLQDGDPYDKVFNRWFIKPLAPLLDYGFRSAGIVQVISEYLGGWPQKRGYRGEVVLVRNGANPKNLTETIPSEAKEIKEKLGKKSDDVYLLIAARLVYQKGIDNVIKALTLLPRNICFVVVGGGPDENMLNELAREKGVDDRVHFVGAVDRNEVPFYRNTLVSDIFVHPSRSEGLGNSVLSAMGARLPVIATQEGGLAEFIFDEKRNPDKPTTAWAVDTDSPEQIAEAVKDILAHPEKVKQITETAREMVLKEFNWEEIAKDMRQKVFSKVL